MNMLKVLSFREALRINYEFGNELFFRGKCKIYDLKIYYFFINNIGFVYNKIVYSEITLITILITANN